jgi:TolB protein
MLGIVLKLRRFGLVAISALALLQASAHAQLTIEITGAGANRIPVAIAEFGGEASAARVVTSVVRGDLERSGLFKMIDPGARS